MESGFRELEPEVTKLLRNVIYDSESEISDSTSTCDDDDDHSHSSISDYTPDTVPLRQGRKKAGKHRRSRSMDPVSMVNTSEKYSMLRELPSDDYQPPIKTPKAQLSAKHSPIHNTSHPSPLSATGSSDSSLTPILRRKNLDHVKPRKRSQTNTDAESPRAPQSPRQHQVGIKPPIISAKNIPPSPKIPPPPPRRPAKKANTDL